MLLQNPYKYSTDIIQQCNHHYYLSLFIAEGYWSVLQSQLVSSGDYCVQASSVRADASSCVLADHSWSGLSGPDTDADATHSQGPPGQDLCNALGKRLQVA